MPAKTLRGTEFRPAGQTHGPKDALIIDAHTHRVRERGLRQIDK